MTTADVSVRPARAADAAAVAEVQVDAWRTCYAPRLPEGALDALDVTVVEATWRAAVTAPPSPRHQLLVAISAGRLVGYAALGPADDPDAAESDGELFAFTIEPAEQRMGHGSRLLAAAMDIARELHFSYVRQWTFDGDAALHAFLAGSGWAADGAARTLEMGGEGVGQQRWHTALD